MNSRLLISLLCAGAVALACGSIAKHEASSAQVSTARHSSVHVSAPKNEAPRVKGSLNVNVEAHALHLALNLKNEGKKNVELAFPNGQQYEFSVIDSAGREVYRWGAGRMFTQSVQNRLLDGGDIMRIEERVDATLPRGKYVAVATLRSTNFPISEKSEFVLR